MRIEARAIPLPERIECHAAVAPVVDGVRMNEGKNGSEVSLRNRVVGSAPHFRVRREQQRKPDHDNDDAFGQPNEPNRAHERCVCRFPVHEHDWYRSPGGDP